MYTQIPWNATNSQRYKQDLIAMDVYSIIQSYANHLRWLVYPRAKCRGKFPGKQPIDWDLFTVNKKGLILRAVMWRFRQEKWIQRKDRYPCKSPTSINFVYHHQSSCHYIIDVKIKFLYLKAEKQLRNKKEFKQILVHPHKYVGPNILNFIFEK